MQISLLKPWKTVRLDVQYDVYLNTWVTFPYLNAVVYFQVRLGGDFVCSELIVRLKFMQLYKYFIHTLFVGQFNRTGVYQ